METARRNEGLNSNIYYQELSQQLEERNRQHKLDKLKDNVAGIEHTKKWDNMVSESYVVLSGCVILSVCL